MVSALLVLLPMLINAVGPERFVENKGQWNDLVHFRSLTEGGYVYVGEDGITINQLENGFFDLFHSYIQGRPEKKFGRTHTIRLEIVGGVLENPEPEEDLGYRENYFLGNDPRNHATNVRSFKRIYYSDIYEGIDMRMDARRDGIKYDFIVHPGSSPDDIFVRIQSAEQLFLSDKNLIIRTSVGHIIEKEPFAYQYDEFGRIEKVPCAYKLEGDIIKYEFPEDYDHERKLIIDPELAFSTYVGAQSDNFGFTASYDSEGHLYGGAIVFGSQYPIEGGPFQVDFAGGDIDCGITKFSTDGTDLIYSTFLGGMSNEAPHSLVVNENDELFILGTTGSFNFPTTSGAFQGNFAGGEAVAGLGYNYLAGVDIFITKISESGDEILASTFVGGSGNDGIGVWEPLEFNYGDIFRGEIVVADNGDICVASVTESIDFPYENGFSSSFNGFSSGAIFRMNSDLTDLIWSSATGGEIGEAAYGLQISNDGTIYVTGGTTSVNVPGTDNGADPGYSGSVDGFLMRISSDGSTVLNATYIGTFSFDQTYFVQLDDAGDPYVIGQSLGDIEVTEGVYFNPNSSQFIRKYSADLSELIWSTRIGSTDGTINFSPSAFLVTQCNEIYISGWGGSVNGIATAGGSTMGLPTTPDAFQPITDGSDFYLMVLSADAEELIYATFFGGSSSEHVDGGTSRFDKNGTVYQAVCAGCGGLDDFPTQPGVWSQNNPSTNCNLGVFKFRLSSVSAEAELDATTDALCTDQPVEFTNLSEDADEFLWEFGDGNTSTEINPTHVYTDPGSYQIKLVAYDSEGCLGPDSTFLDLEILPAPELVFEFENIPICSGDQLQLLVSGADEYLWSPAEGLSNANIANPMFTGTTTTTYIVTGTNACGTQEAETTIQVGTIDIEVEEEVTLCPGESYELSASGGSDYSWTPPTYLDDPNSSSPTVTPESDITYLVSAIDDQGCESTAQVEINLLPPQPEVEGDTSYVVCNGVPVTMVVSGSDNYSWSPTLGLSDAFSSSTQANPSETTVYTVTSENECGSTSLEITVSVSAIEVNLFSDTISCYLSPLEVQASGADNYFWSPPEYFASPTSPSTVVTLPEATEIKVVGINEEGCSGTASQIINIYPRPWLTAGKDKAIPYGGEAILEAFSPLIITWEESPFLSCLECYNPVAFPEETTTFYATVESGDGCIERDSVEVIVSGDLYVPNAFTPDGDGINDVFKAKGIDIVEFKIEIFNRWGELIFQSESIEEGWNGSSGASDYYAPSGVYPYRIVAVEHTGQLFEVRGNVTLIR